MTTAFALIGIARRFIGVRFAHQGRTAMGLDCLGLLMITAQEAGMLLGGVPIDQMDIPAYGARPDVALLQARLDAVLQPVPVNTVQVGDVVLLKIDGSPQHLALISDYPMVGELGMIHAYAPAREVIEHRYARNWQRATYRAYRLPGLIETIPL